MSTSEENIDMDYLISLIQEREILWDRFHVDFKNKILKGKAWAEVTKNLFPEYDSYAPDQKNKIGNTVVKKWKNVKDTFFKHLKKIKEASKSGSAAKKLAKYHYFNQLLFLTKIAQNATDDSLNASVPEPSRYVPVTRKKKAKLDDFEKDTLDALQALNEKENRHLSFFKGILPSIEDFTELQTLTFQSKVLQLITEMRYGQTTTQSSSYAFEEQLSHGYQTRNYQSTGPYSSINSNSDAIQSPNQDYEVSQNSNSDAIQSPNQDYEVSQNSNSDAIQSPNQDSEVSQNSDEIEYDFASL